MRATVRASGTPAQPPSFPVRLVSMPAATDPREQTFFAAALAEGTAAAAGGDFITPPWASCTPPSPPHFCPCAVGVSGGNGGTGGSGGGVFNNSGTTTLVACTVNGNSVFNGNSGGTGNPAGQNGGPGNGGGLANAVSSASVILRNTLLAQNT